MPIRPENVARYPPDWNEIRERIRKRARNRCEECGVKNHSLGGRDRKGRWFVALPLGENLRGIEWPEPGTHSWCLHKPTGESQQLRIIRIVCTVAHLDHQPENCADENLRFWCQRDHLRYDRQHHSQTAYRTRREGKAVEDMFA